ncbi:MAG: DUF2231 domain-containing protein [Terriglobales bacterium]
MTRTLAQTAARQQWIDPVADGLHRGLDTVIESLGPRRDQLRAWAHGEPLGHPLHAMLTDVPLGAWTTALIFDLMAGRQPRQPWASAARGAIGIGLAGALAAAVTGLADWHQITDREVRRIGLVHGLVNVLGVSAFTLSFLRRRRPGHGRRSALAGFALAATAAQLGGTLVYQHRIGIRGAVLPQASQPAA